MKKYALRCAIVCNAVLDDLVYCCVICGSGRFEPVLLQMKFTKFYFQNIPFSPILAAVNAHKDSMVQTARALPSPSTTTTMTVFQVESCLIHSCTAGDSVPATFGTHALNPSVCLHSTEKRISPNTSLDLPEV
ncbi:hypothetical protein CBL_05771 [Carabus blaptoides fortunei]